VNTHELAQRFETILVEQDAINAYGVILYTDEHPHIKKLLRDKDYWTALDKKSGLRWAIFAARDAKIEKGDASPFAKMLSVVVRKVFAANTRQILIPAGRDPQISYTFAAKFGIPFDDLPVFVLFTPLPDGRILHAAIKIADKSQEDAFERLNSVIGSLTSAVEKIQSENRHDYESVFRAVNMEAFHIKVHDRLQAGVKVFQWIKDIFV
jgi:hypothetical protein